MHDITLCLKFDNCLINIKFVSNIQFQTYPTQFKDFNNYYLINNNELILNKLFFPNYVEFSIENVTIISSKLCEDNIFIEFDSYSSNCVRKTAELVRTFLKFNHDIGIYDSLYRIRYQYKNDLTLKILNNYDSPFLYLRIIMP